MGGLEGHATLVDFPQFHNHGLDALILGMHVVISVAVEHELEQRLGALGERAVAQLCDVAECGGILPRLVIDDAHHGLRVDAAVDTVDAVGLEGEVEMGVAARQHHVVDGMVHLTFQYLDVIGRVG